MIEHKKTWVIPIILTVCLILALFVVAFKNSGCPEQIKTKTILVCDNYTLFHNANETTELPFVVDVAGYSYFTLFVSHTATATQSHLSIRWSCLTLTEPYSGISLMNSSIAVTDMLSERSIIAPQISFSISSGYESGNPPRSGNITLTIVLYLYTRWLFDYTNSSGNVSLNIIIFVISFKKWRILDDNCF